VELLGHPREMSGELTTRPVPQSTIMEPDLPRCGGEQTRQRLEQRALPHPVGAENRPALTGSDAKVHADDDGRPAMAGAQAGGLQHAPVRHGSGPQLLQRAPQLADLRPEGGVIGLGVADPLRDPLVALAEQEQRALTGALRAEALEEFGGALPLHPELARRDRRSALRSTG